MKVIDFNKYNEFLESFNPYYDELNFPDEKKQKVQEQIDMYLSDDFDTYEMSEGDGCTHQDFCYMDQVAILHAIYLNNSPGLYSKVFKDDSLSPNEFLNIAYFYEVMTIVSSDSFQKLCPLYIQIIEGLSLKKLLQGIREDSSIGTDDMSEVDFYDQLQGLNIRDLTLLIELIDAERETKNLLKKCVIDSDENTFFLVCREQNIDFQKPAAVAYFWNSLLMCKDLFSHIINEDTQIETAFDAVMNNEKVEIDEATFDLYDSLKKLTSPTVEGVPVTDFYEQYKHFTLTEALVVACCKELKKYSINVESFDQLEEVIASDSYYNMLSETISLDDFDTKNYRVCQPLIEFKDTFLTQKTLPKSVPGEKSVTDYYDSNNVFSLLELLSIYKLLVKYDMVDTEDDTFYSLIFRLSNKYQGENAPSIIAWRGEPNDLYYFVEWFTGGSAAGKKWDKTAKFFMFADGRAPRKDAAHYKSKPSKKMMELEKEMKKIKSHLST